MREFALGLLGLLLSCGCSSGYEPARSPRITTVVEGGMPTFVKDGERYGGPTFGVGLVHAVHGNPRAEQQARVGRNLAIGGFVLDMTGLGCEFGGLVALGHETDRGRPSALGAGLVFGGLGAVIVGSVMLLSAQPHLYDAINIYNDGLDKPQQ